MHFISWIIFICFVGSVDEKPTGREGWLCSWEVRVLEIWIAHATPSLSIAISALVSCYDCWYQSCYHYPGWGLLFWAQEAHVELLEAAKPWSCSLYHNPYLQSIPESHKGFLCPLLAATRPWRISFIMVTRLSVQWSKVMGKKITDEMNRSYFRDRV